MATDYILMVASLLAGLIWGVILGMANSKRILTKEKRWVPKGSVYDGD